MVRINPEQALSTLTEALCWTSSSSAFTALTYLNLLLSPASIQPRARQFLKTKQPLLNKQLQEGETADFHLAPAVQSNFPFAKALLLTPRHPLQLWQTPLTCCVCLSLCWHQMHLLSAACPFKHLQKSNKYPSWKFLENKGFFGSLSFWRQKRAKVQGWRLSKAFSACAVSEEPWGEAIRGLVNGTQRRDQSQMGFFSYAFLREPVSPLVNEWVISRINS